MIPDTLLRISNALFVASPDGSFWATAIIWVLRIVTILFILRNYIAPYVLARVAGIRSIRVRSISLRSIRGIYFKHGIRTWRVDRIGISYRSASGEGSSRFTVKIEGLKLEIGRTRHVPFKPASSRKGKRRLTLSDLSPSPLAFYYLWSIAASVYALLEPYFRPVIRSITVACMRVFIRCLPALTQALHFDLDSAEVTFLASPQSCIRIKEATLHTQLDFTLLEDVILSGVSDSGAASSTRVRSMNMAALRTRFSKSFARTWERAWGKAQGTASITVTVKEVSGLTPLSSQRVPGISFSPVDSALGIYNHTPGPAMETFFSLPGSVDFRSSLRFSPSRGIIDPHSLKADLNVDSVQIFVDALHSLLALLKYHHRFEPTSPREAPPSTFTSTAETVSPTIPMSPFIRALRSATSSRVLTPKLKEARHSVRPDSS